MTRDAATGRELAEREFLAASVAVWREIDRLSEEPGGYKGLPPSTDLRIAEAESWERYKQWLDRPTTCDGTWCELGVFEQRAEVEKRLAEIRKDAERAIVFPITRDDALWLCDRIQAVIDATIDARVTYGLINPDAEDIAASASPMFTERDVVIRALYTGGHDADARVAGEAAGLRVARRLSHRPWWALARPRVPRREGEQAMNEPSAAPVDPLEAEVRAMSDDELRERIEAIRGNSKRAGSRARRLNMAESLALAALMAEEARRAVA